MSDNCVPTMLRLQEAEERIRQLEAENASLREQLRVSEENHSATARLLQISLDQQQHLSEQLYALKQPVSDEEWAVITGTDDLLEWSADRSEVDALIAARTQKAAK